MRLTTTNLHSTRLETVNVKCAWLRRGFEEKLSPGKIVTFFPREDRVEVISNWIEGGCLSLSLDLNDQYVSFSIYYKD